VDVVGGVEGRARVVRCGWRGEEEGVVWVGWEGGCGDEEMRR
jgi:hypothetical protein